MSALPVPAPVFLFFPFFSQKKWPPRGQTVRASLSPGGVKRFAVRRHQEAAGHCAARLLRICLETRNASRRSSMSSFVRPNADLRPKRMRPNGNASDAPDLRGKGALHLQRDERIQARSTDVPRRSASHEATVANPQPRLYRFSYLHTECAVLERVSRTLSRAIVPFAHDLPVLTYSAGDVRFIRITIPLLPVFFRRTPFRTSGGSHVSSPFCKQTNVFGLPAPRGSDCLRCRTICAPCTA